MYTRGLCKYVYPHTAREHMCCMAVLLLISFFAICLDHLELHHLL